MLQLNYIVEKATKNTIKFVPDVVDPAYAGSSLYLQKSVVKEFGLDNGFVMTIEKKEEK